MSRTGRLFSESLLVDQIYSAQKKQLVTEIKSMIQPAVDDGITEEFVYGLKKMVSYQVETFRAPFSSGPTTNLHCLKIDHSL